MASDKFGNNPVAPLYNATGRNPRDIDMGNPGKPLGSVGSSGAGGKDFGISGQAPKKADMFTSSYFSPMNPYNIIYERLDRRMGGAPGRRRRGGGGGSGSGSGSGDSGGYFDASGREIDLDASLALTKAATPQTVNFAKQMGGDDNSVDESVGKNATVSDQGMISGTDSVGGDQYKENELKSTIKSGSEPAGPAKPTRKPRTAEQLAATKAKREAKKAENPNYGKRNPNRPPRTPKPAKPAAKPAAPRTVVNEQRIGNLRNTTTVGGNFA